MNSRHPALKVKRASRTIRLEEAASQTARIDMGRVGQAIGYALRRAQVAVFEDYARTMASLHIRPVQHAVLTIVHCNPGLKQSDVAGVLGIQRANLVALLDELEDLGLVERINASHDRRANKLHLTAKGEKLIAQLDKLNDAHNKRYIDKIGRKSYLRLLDVLRKLGQ